MGESKLAKHRCRHRLSLEDVVSYSRFRDAVVIFSAMCRKSFRSGVTSIIKSGTRFNSKSFGVHWLSLKNDASN